MADGGSVRITLLAHDRVEEVVQEPHAAVDLVEQVGVGDGVEAGEANVAADERAVLPWTSARTRLFARGLSFLWKGRERDRVRWGTACFQ